MERMKFETADGAFRNMTRVSKLFPQMMTEVRDVSGQTMTVHAVNGGDLIACFDANVPEPVIREIAKHKPLRNAFRDASFSSSPEKINDEEIFKLLSPATTVKVI